MKKIRILTLFLSKQLFNMFKPQYELGIKHTIKLFHPGKTVYLTYFLFLVRVQTCCFFFSSSSVVTSNLKF